MDLYSSWLPQSQSQQLAPESSQHTIHESLSTDDWKERAPTNGQPSGARSPSTQTTLDLSDFVLGDITAPAGPSSPPSQPFYGQSFQNFFMSSSVPGPYNAMSYGTSWASQPPHVPLSNYSSLNGATSSSASSPSHQTQQPHQQQQQALPPATHQMMIDPALTTMNGSSSSSNGIQHQHSQSSSNSLQNSPSQPQHSQFQYQHLHSSSSSINPSFVHSSHYFPSQTQVSLSPGALHSPSVMPTAMSPSSFYSPPSSSQTLSPEVRKQQFQNAIRPLLLPTAFTGAGAVHSLVTLINDYGSQDVDGSTRLDIVTKIRDKAGNHYFRAWAENATAIDISREWLKAAFTSKSDSPLVETIMPILHIIDRLPLTVESLKASKLGKIVVKLVKDPPTPAIKDMASNVERRWRQMVTDGGPKPDNNQAEDAKSKKRKPSEPPPSKVPPPTKKVAMAASTSSSRPMVKKEAKVTAVKDAKSDSSFFSAPKPKPKLPSFKKAPPVPVKKEPDSNVAQPSSFDPFQDALKAMAKARKDSPAISTPPPTTSAGTPPGSTHPVKPAKKRKSVTWAAEGQLESVRFIEKAIYDDDPVDGMHTTVTLRDLDRGEGAALHAHLFEEAIDWYEPTHVEIPEDVDLRQRGEKSIEKFTQEEREQTALGALYMSLAQIPDSPAEPSSVITEEEVDKDVRVMTSGAEVDAVFWSSAPMPNVPALASVADLVSQLNAGNVDQSMAPANGKPFNLDPAAFSTVAAVQNMAPEQLQQLFQQLTQPSGMFAQAAGQPNVQPPYGGIDQNWNSFAEYGQGYEEGEPHDRRWSDGRGHGRGRGSFRPRNDDSGYRHSKRKPCSFFAAGRCKFGDQCDFSHEPIY